MEFWMHDGNNAKMETRQSKTRRKEGNNVRERRRVR